MKSKEFREAIQEIVGFKLAFYDNGQVRVTSQYDLECSFVFKPAEPGEDGGPSMTKMQLVGQGGGGPEEIPNLMKYWVEEQMCIPGFMASITLECFDRKVRMEREAMQMRR
jgi:mitotic spindle assembly checkpoint protein MAD1